MLRSVTVKRVVLVLVVAGVFGLGLGAGIWMAKTNGASAFPFANTQAFAQSGDYLMSCGVAHPLEQAILEPPYVAELLEVNYFFVMPCVIVNTSTGHWI